MLLTASSISVSEPKRSYCSHNAFLYSPKTELMSVDGGETIPTLRTIADYQFGAGAGRALFPSEGLSIRRTSSGRPQQVLTTDEETGEPQRLVTFTTDGRFTLGLAGGRRLAAAMESPACRVVVADESEPFVRDGKNVFAKFVQEVDTAVRAGDEVVVTHERGDVLAVGRTELSAVEMADFDTGMAVKVRAGAPKGLET